jgi:hypothetical protein
MKCFEHTERGNGTNLAKDSYGLFPAKPDLFHMMVPAMP